MSSEAHLEPFEKILTAGLSRAIEFVRFAETKNAALLTFASAWTLASVGFLTSDRILPSAWRMAFTTALPLFGVAALVAIISFLPRTALHRFHRDPEHGKALLFFGDAARFEPAAYNVRLRERYLSTGDKPFTQRYLEDLAIQISVNSKIAARKFLLFNVGAAFVLLAILTIAAPGTLDLAAMLSRIGSAAP